VSRDRRFLPEIFSNLLVVFSVKVDPYYFSVVLFPSMTRGVPEHANGEIRELISVNIRCSGDRTRLPHSPFYRGATLDSLSRSGKLPFRLVTSPMTYVSPLLVRWNLLRHSVHIADRNCSCIVLRLINAVILQLTRSSEEGSEKSNGNYSFFRPRTAHARAGSSIVPWAVLGSFVLSRSRIAV
jgi:hypothetical protein